MVNCRYGPYQLYLDYFASMLLQQESIYNRNGQRWLESTYSAVAEGKVLLSTIAKPGMFGLGVAPKENFLPYST